MSEKKKVSKPKNPLTKKNSRKSQKSNIINFEELPADKVDTNSVIKEIKKYPSKFKKYVEMPLKKLRKFIIENQSVIWFMLVVFVPKIVNFEQPRVIEIWDFKVTEYRRPRTINEACNNNNLNEEIFKIMKSHWDQKYALKNKKEKAKMRPLSRFYRPLYINHSLHNYKKVFKNDKSYTIHDIKQADFDQIFENMGRFLKAQYGYWVTQLHETEIREVIRRTLLVMEAKYPQSQEYGKETVFTESFENLYENSHDKDKILLRKIIDTVLNSAENSKEWA